MPECHQAVSPRRGSWLRWGLGLASLLWLLLRSGPNPRRLAYPCQQAALAGATGFLAALAAGLGASRLFTLIRRRTTLGVAGALGLTAILLAVLAGPGHRSAAAPRALLDLPTWSSATAVSTVYLATGVPAPPCSVAGGALPASGPCADPEAALADTGVDALVLAMEGRGDWFFRHAAHPGGVVGADDVVVIKVNNQWGGLGDSGSEGRMATSTDVLKGLIWRILQHPDGFTGEVVVMENTQGVNPAWDTTPANAEDPDQSYLDVVTAFESIGAPVSLYSLDDINWSLVSGGSVGAAGYPAGEYAQGAMDDAYILLEDPAGTGSNELSYPKFQTAGGRRVSLRYGVWTGAAYDSDRLAFINLPVLKKHGMAGATIAWKNLVGFVTISDESSRFGSWDAMHDFFWGYEGGGAAAYGLIGRELALVRAPDLNLVDAIWVATDDNTGGAAVRADVLLASRDPFAVDWYASEYVLRPVVTWDADGSSAARAGTFRSATRTNQNAAAAVWPGDAYPYIDLLDGYDGSTPSATEQQEMSVLPAPLPIFFDGFESGATTRWSAASAWRPSERQLMAHEDARHATV